MHLLVPVRRNPLPGHPQPVQQLPDGLSRAQRIAVVVEAAQIHIELAVGEAVPDPVPPVHGEGGLADPGRAADRRDGHGPGRVLGRLRGGARAGRQQGVQPGQFLVPSAEPAHHMRQSGGHPRQRGVGGRLGGAGRYGRFGDGNRVRPALLRHGQRRVLAQDALVHPAQLGPRVDAEVVGEPMARGLVQLQRLRLPFAAVQRRHQLPYRPLVQRVRRRLGAQLRQQFTVVAEAQRGVVQLQPRREPFVREAGPGRLRPGSGQPAEGVSAPQVQRLP